MRKKNPYPALLASGIALFTVSALEACPLCFASTPYRSGLVWATVFLLPIPFLLTGGIAYWIFKNSGNGTEDGGDQE